MGASRTHSIPERRQDAAPKYAWTDELDEADLDYLRSLPFTITLPRLDALVVHAGLVPGVPLAAQDVVAMVSMRDVVVGDEGDYAPLEKASGESVPWSGAWVGPPHVYFGHDAQRKLQLEKCATGLDTGCVYGGELSAAILREGEAPRVVSVRARQVYSQPGGGGGKAGEGGEGGSGKGGGKSGGSKGGSDKGGGSKGDSDGTLCAVQRVVGMRGMPTLMWGAFGMTLAVAGARGALDTRGVLELQRAGLAAAQRHAAKVVRVAVELLRLLVQTVVGCRATPS